MVKSKSILKQCFFVIFFLMGLPFLAHGKAVVPPDDIIHTGKVDANTARMIFRDQALDKFITVTIKGKIKGPTTGTNGASVNIQLFDPKNKTKVRSIFLKVAVGDSREIDETVPIPSANTDIT